MKTLDPAGHWDKVHAHVPITRSWFQDRPLASLRMLDGAGLVAQDSLIDVGGGPSSLTVLDSLMTSLRKLGLGRLEGRRGRGLGLHRHRAPLEVLDEIGVPVVAEFPNPSPTKWCRPPTS